MTDLNGGTDDVHPDWKTNLMTTSARPVQSQLKYYIHDSTAALRFQLLGMLSEGDVGELQGCWITAKTTLAGRKLLIDLRALRSTDEAGKQWLLSMAHEGAEYLPESYFRSGLAGQEEGTKSKRPSRLLRVAALFRGRHLPAGSSTRVP